jgi:hypothetical protein
MTTLNSSIVDSYIYANINKLERIVAFTYRKWLSESSTSIANLVIIPLNLSSLNFKTYDKFHILQIFGL